MFRRSRLETLERRELLAAEVLAIRPDSAGLLQDGDVLNVAPREFNLYFNGGANLDEATINANTVRLVRSGGDGVFDGNDIQVALGYVGLVNPGSTDPSELQRIVLRPASDAAHNATDPAVAFPDDLYQIQIIGSGATPLADRDGQAYGGGTDSIINFRLDRGAQVLAVVPQPITRAPNGTLTQASNQIVVHFDDQLLNRADAENPKFFRLVDTRATLDTSDDQTRLPQTAQYDATDNTVTLTFASALPEGTYRLDIGLSDGGSATPGTAIRIGTLFNENHFSHNGYLGDDSEVAGGESQPDFYRVELTAGANLRIELTQHEPALNASARLIDANQNALTLTSLGAGIWGYTVPAGAAGDYYIEVSSSDGSSGSYRIDASVTGNAISASDNNTTFGTATNLGSLGAAGVRVAARIQPQTIPLPPQPGSLDEPGHREIQREAHIGAYGTTPVVPSPIAEQTQRVYYHFPAAFPNLTSPGQSFLNQITAEEKRIVYAILDVYASLSGYEFIETPNFGLAFGKTDLRAFDPDIGPNSGVAGLGGGAGAIANASLYQDSDRSYGDGFTSLMFHEIGHAIGLGHSYEIPSNQGGGLPNDLLPGDHDIVHLQRIMPTNSTDIDLYRFELSESGRFAAETFAERLATPSLLDTLLTLYRETPDGEREIIARNDRYFGSDSFIGLDLEPGVYFIGVSSSGNDNYDPNVPDSGHGGKNYGAYELSLSFEADRGGALRDADGTPIDGDGDGNPGGVHQFWFQASDVDTTIFVDRANDPRVTLPDGNGSLSNPFDTLSTALAEAGSRIVVPERAASEIQEHDSFILDDGSNERIFTFGPTGSIDLSGLTTAVEVAGAIAAAINASDVNITATVAGRVVRLSGLDRLDLAATPALMGAPNLVRIVGNGGLDGDINTPADNQPYLLGTDSSGNPLRDGQEFLVPQGVTVMLDAGALIKLRAANLDAGTSSVNLSRAASAIQVLGTPQVPVWLRSYRDDTFGGNSDGIGPAPQAGDFGGIVFRADSDLEERGIFLNHVTHVDIRHGGGTVFVDSNEQVFSPIHLVDARPAVRFNHFTQNADAAVSASPNSFEESLGRIGPDILGNYLHGNSIDGLFIRIPTQLGSTASKLTVPGRFDDTDIPHVLTENLLISGNPGGPVLTPDGNLVARAAGRLVVDPGVVVKLSGARIEAERGASSLIAEGTVDRPVIFTSLRDDRFGGSGSFDTNSGGASEGAPGEWAGFYFGQVSSGSFDHALIAFAGGNAPIEGGSAYFNTIEVHQAQLRISNSLLRDNASGTGAGTSANRAGRGFNQAAVLYVRGAQPIVVGNTFVDNAGPVINLNANSLNYQSRPDYGRSTGNHNAFDQFADNYGPLVRHNRLSGNAINGMVVRGEELTTESIWDDTDSVHVLQGEVVVGNHHTFSGLRLQSSNSESLVIKLAGANAGFTATGKPLDIIDRIGGTIQVLGTPGFPVVLTHLADDSVGAGYAPDGTVMTNTNNTSDPSVGVSGGWRGFIFDEWSNDRNVAVIRERENPLTSGADINRMPGTAQTLGVLAPNEKSGDENRRLGFEVHGFISPDDPGDVDVYSFRGTAGTPIWIDVDRTDSSLDLIVEVLNANGGILARSVRSGDVAFPGNLNAGTLTQNPLLGGDHYTQNFRDPGLHYVLPGSPGSEGTYFVRVRSNPQTTPITALAGQSSGKYQLQVRLQQIDEFPGSTVQYADIRFAQTAIDVRGLPSRSPLVGEAGELPGDNNTYANAQQLVNLLETDMAAISLAGGIENATDVDWYRFDLQHAGVQAIGGVNDDPGTVAVVFDIDFAHGAVRGDTTIAIYDENQQLVFVGRESNIQDDQATSSNATADLSRGSFGNKDPYIGPIHLRPGGSYYVAVMNDRHLPSALTGAYVASPAQAGNGLVRLEPVNSVRRVVEDHIGFQGYNSNGVLIGPETPGIFDISTSQTLSNHVVPFTLEDIVLYVATDVAGNNADGDHLYTVNPYATERYLTRVSPDAGLVSGVNDVQDIVIRSDGRMFGYQRLDNVTNSVGALVEIDPTTGQTTVVGNDNIRGRSPVPNTRDIHTDFGSHLTRAEHFTTSDEVDAFTFQRRGTTGPASAPVPFYDTYLVARETDVSGLGANSKLYRGRGNGDASAALATSTNPRYGLMGDIQPAGVEFASTNLTVFNNADPAAFTTIRIESKVPGEAGNDIRVNISRPNNTNANVTSVNGTTINLQIGGTTNAAGDITGGATAEAIVNAINNHADARRLVTAVIVGGSDNGNGTNGTVTFSYSIGNNGNLTGGEDGLVGPLKGRVTGISYGNFLSSTNLYGVTTAGEFIEINPNNGTVIRKLDIANALGVSNINFQGLTLGPQNVEGGTYANTLFAVDSNGALYAINTQLVSSVADGNDAGQVLAVMRNIFAGGSYSAQATGMSGGAVGLAFSPLDFNLWHTTMKRGGDAGHGINEAPDSSRTPDDVNVSIVDPGPGPNRTRTQADGGASLHFGFEQWVQNHTNDTPSYLTYETGVNAQLGLRTTVQHQDLSSNPAIVGTYNFPGGALGSLVSGEFSLAGSVADDRPTLYFNYFLETENHDGSNVTDDVDDPFRDSARVFASRNGGLTWELVATNNSQLSGADPTDGAERAELPGFLSHLSDAGLNSPTPRTQAHQIVQELMDNTGQWRQARIDLSTFAGEDSIQLRFDFSTAGAMRDASLGLTDASFGEFQHNERSIRSLANAFEGFYIDDIIVGYAERGEMVTGAIADSSITNLGTGARTQNRDPEAFPDVLTGRYQLEVRRVDEYAAGTDDIRVGTLFDTNDRHINDTTQTAWVNYEPGGSNVNLTPPFLAVGDLVLPGTMLTSWTISTDQPLTGQRSLRSGNVTDSRPVSVFQASAAQLGSSSTAAGIIEFTYRVSSREHVNGLRFYIDGVPQTLDYSSSEQTPEDYDPTLASGESGYRTVSFPFGSGNPTFTWVYDFQDQSNAGGQNRAWVDDIKLMQGGTGRVADRNRQRPQGMFIIDSNTITDSAVRGINVQPGTTQAGGNVPHPGSTINFVQLNQERLVPGVVIQNNIVAGASAIRFAGETDANPQRPVPFGRIVNNTLVGDGGGVGIQVDGLASPTVMNNIITEFATGLGGSLGTAVIQSNYFQANGDNGNTGANAIERAAGTPLFVDAANGNYYLVGGSAAADSSLNTLQDRFNYVNFKNQIGIPPSPIVAPDRDVFGQLRVDSGQSPGGGGATIFKDRGAVDRADFDAPFAILLDPIDNDITGIDRDPNATIVSLPDPIVDAFSILLTDGRGPNAPFEGTGVNPLTVSRDSVTVHRNNRLLVEGVDYRIGYNDSTGEVRLTPLSTLWEPGGVYEIELDNEVIRDRAGNRLRNNQPDGSTRFVIILPEVGFDFGDAPDSYGTLLGSDGARHALVDGAVPRLGRYVDAENGIGAVDDDTPLAITVTPGTAADNFVVTDSGSSQVSVQLAATPATSGAALTVDVGSGPRTFELVFTDVAPQAGNVAVRFATSDTPEEIAERLAAAIRAELGTPGDALSVSVDGDTIELVNQDDEDGIGIGTLNGTNDDYIVFLRPEEAAYPQYPPTTDTGADVLGFLNPLDPAGARVAVTVTGSGFLDGWIDLDGNGVFDPESEKVFDSVAVVDGVNILTIVTPAGTADGITWARFRLSSEGGLQPTGLAIGGEVEDFQVQIVSVPLPEPANDAYSVDEDTTLDTQAAGLASIVDNDETFPDLRFTPYQIVLVAGPENAESFTFDPATGHFVYTPLSDFSGEDTFTYYLANQQAAVDNMPAGTQLGTVTINVRPVNDPPLAQNHTFVGLEDTAITITAEALLADAAAHFDPQYPAGAPDAPWDESNQSLRIVSFRAGTTLVNAANAGNGPFATAHGTLEPTFDPDTGSLLSLIYRPNTDLNRDNVTLLPWDGELVFDLFEFTIEDDGILIDPVSGAEIPAAPLTHTATATIDVAPQNDDPTTSNDRVTVGTIGAGSISPIDAATLWSQYFTGLGLEVPVPTEDQPLTIPAAFLLQNDLAGSGTALDENLFTNDNDGPLRIIDVAIDAGDATVELIEDGDGNVTGVLFTPPTNVYGDVVFTYTVEDRGVDEDELGGRIVTPRTSTGTVTVNLQPVNDAPTSFDRELSFAESAQAGVSGPFTFTAAQLLSGSAGETPAIAGPSDPALDAPFNEQEQQSGLRVVAFATGRGSVDVADLPNYTGPGTGSGTLELLSDAGGRFEFVFVAGALTTARYFTSPDYNQAIEEHPFEQLRYTIEDHGRTTDPQTGQVVSLPAVRSESEATLTIRVSETNDAPVFNFQTVVDILERDDNGETVVAGWATDILPGPPTASDELQSQGVSFSFVGYGSGPGTSNPQDLFLQAPEVSADGSLSLFPRPDAVGTAILIVRATDFELEPSDGFQPRSTDATFTVNVRPVNDAPRINTAVVGTDQALNNDEQWRVDAGGVITYTLKEDNTQAQGVTQPYIIDMRRSTPLPAYGRIGLLDVFTVGPANEADGTLGGSQILRLLSFDSTTALGGTVEAIGFDDAGNITQLQYTPPQDYNSSLGGVDSFNYVVQDNNPDNGETWSLDNASLGEDRRTASGRVEFVLRPVNDAPQFTLGEPVASVLEDSGPTAFEGFASNIFAGGPDTAFDELDPVTGQDVTFSVTPVSPGANNLFATTPTISPDGTLTFEPAANAYGTAVFTVRAIDSGADNSGRGDLNASAAQTFTINIRPVNDRPVLNTTTPISYTLNEDAAILQPDGTVTFQGTFIPLRGSGAVVGLLDVFNVGPDNEAADITPGGNQSLRITTPIPGSTAQGGTLTRVFDPLDPSVLIGLRYTPRANFNGTDSFIYGVIDDGVSTDLEGNVFSDPREAFNTITLNVLPLNDRPQFSGPLSVTVEEDATTTPVIGQSIVPNFVTDITPGPAGAVDELQNQTVSFTVTPVSGNAESLFVATPQVSSDGTLTFQTLPDANGVAVFTIVAVDSGPDNAPLEFNTSSPPRTFTITVNPVNDAPTFTPALNEITVAEDSGPFTTSDPFATEISPGPADEVAAGQTVRFEVTTPAADEALFQTLPLVTDNGFLRFTPAENAVGTTIVSVVAIDSEGGVSAPVLVTITITEVNDAPVAGDLTLTNSEDEVLPISEQSLLELAADPDLNTNPNEVLGFTEVATTSQAGATIRVLPSGDLEYDPRGSQTLQALRPGQTLADTFTYRLIDASGAISNIATVTINVTGVNDAPTVNDDFATLNPDGVTTIRPLDNDFDVDGTINPASIQITLQPAFGSISVQNDGTLIYTPFDGFRGTDTIRYTVADETGARSEQATITIDMNEAPVAVDDIVGTYRGRSIDIDVASNDFDPDLGGALDLDSIEIVTPPSGGTAIVLGGGIIRYLPGDNFVGIDTFQYTIRDDRGRPSNIGQVRVQVVASELQNPSGVTDVNGSGQTTPLDALLILNRLARAAREGMTGSIPVELLLDETPRYFYDVSGNRRVEPLDALLVINEIARRNRERANGEGELAAVAAPPIVAASFVDTPAAEHAEPKLLDDPSVELEQAAKSATFDWEDDEAYHLLASDIAETRREKERESTDEQFVDAIWSEF